MTVGCIGECHGGRRVALERYSEEQEKPLAMAPWGEEDVFDKAARADLSGIFDGLQAAFINVPPAYTYPVSQMALRRGVHVFLEWEAMPSLAECEDMALIAEEAGVEVGVSRPLRFHPLFDGWPEGWYASLIDVRNTMQRADAARFQRGLEDAVDLCACFSGAAEARKVEAQIVRGGLARPDALIAGLRFHNGVYAHVQIRRHAPHAAYRVHASGPGFQVDADLLRQIGYLHPADLDENASPDAAFEERSWSSLDLVEQETRAFLRALGSNAPAPISLTDGFRTLRLVEAIRKNLR